jgi:hypothetical protein
VRGKIAEAGVELKVFNKAIANFVKDLLPDTTLVHTPPKRKSVELGTQTITDQATPPPPYETPVTSTRCVVLPTVASDDGDEGGVSEEDVDTFARKSFGVVASPYLLPFVHKRGVLDIEYGLHKEGINFLYVIRT